MAVCAVPQPPVNSNLVEASVVQLLAVRIIREGEFETHFFKLDGSYLGKLNDNGDSVTIRSINESKKL